MTKAMLVIDKSKLCRAITIIGNKLSAITIADKLSDKCRSVRTTPTNLDTTTTRMLLYLVYLSFFLPACHNVNVFCCLSFLLLLRSPSGKSQCWGDSSRLVAKMTRLDSIRCTNDLDSGGGSGSTSPFPWIRSLESICRHWILCLPQFYCEICSYKWR